MKEIKVLGTGCAKCKKTIELIEKTVQEMGLTDVQVEKVEDIMKIMEYQVMRTPAVVLGNEVKITGYVPSVSEIRELLA